MAVNGTETGYSSHKWWKESTVYQIYPASFNSTGAGSEPGWGDIKGITKKLDYLKDLGVDIIWICPVYRSPQADMGYDIADYKDIDPRYGSLSDVDDLIAGLKERGMKLMMDLVVNHTSNEHAWFLDSQSSKTAAKRDWYIWHAPKYDEQGNRQPPNNWAQILGGANSAWTWDEQTQEYYLSLFTPEQPDLNWRNPAVREAVHDILRFWLERGASGFRMDVINLISKVEGYPDADIVIPDEKYQPGHALYANGPHMHEYLREMNEKVLSRYDTITVGEMPFIDDPDEVLQTVSANAHELNMIFIFDLVDIDNGPGHQRLSIVDFTTRDMKRIVQKWQHTMRDRNGWNSVFVENHDNPRSLSRYVDDSDEYREQGAKLLSLFLTTLGGTLYVFQGQELGMRNVPLSWDPEEYKDIETVNYWKKVNDEHPGDKKALEEARRVIQRKARDHSRTPVQWSAEANAGFCAPETKPWMRVNDDYTVCNAASQQESGDSVLAFWRQALKRRKEFKDVFVYGSFELLDEKNEDVFAFQRQSDEGEAWVVALNFSGKDLEWSLPGGLEVARWEVSNYGNDKVNQKAKIGAVALRPWEGVVGRLNEDGRVDSPNS